MKPQNISPLAKTDPQIPKQVQRLHRLTVYFRWIFVVVCWLSLGVFGIWGLRHEIELWREYFTWVAVRYGLFYNPMATLCVAFCCGLTTAVLVWQSRNILIGLSPKEMQRLERGVLDIRATGPSHPLWRFVVSPRKK